MQACSCCRCCCSLSSILVSARITLLLTGNHHWIHSSALVEMYKQACSQSILRLRLGLCSISIMHSYSLFTSVGSHLPSFATNINYAGMIYDCVSATRLLQASILFERCRGYARYHGKRKNKFIREREQQKGLDIKR